MNQRQRQNEQLPGWFRVGIAAVLFGLLLYIVPLALDGVRSLRADNAAANRQAAHPTAAPARVQAETHEVTRQVEVTRVVVQENLVEVTAVAPIQASSHGRAAALPAATPTPEQKRETTKDLVDPAGQGRER